MLLLIHKSLYNTLLYFNTYNTFLLKTYWLQLLFFTLHTMNSVCFLRFFFYLCPCENGKARGVHVSDWTYISIYIFQVHHEFKTTCDEWSVQKLLDTFIKSKQTGTVKPGINTVLEMKILIYWLESNSWIYFIYL